MRSRLGDENPLSPDLSLCSPDDCTRDDVSDIGRSMNDYLNPPGSRWEEESRDLFLSSLEEYEKQLTE